MTIDQIIHNALKEDLGDGDHSSLSCIPKTAQGKAKLLVKANGILAGVEIAKKVFEIVDPKIELEILLQDGAEIKVDDIAFYATGSSLNILKAERLVLNIMQRMSGIATKTNKLIQLIKHTDCKLLDTRKTTPNFRIIEKEAVKIGGGVNHRFGLYDMVMLKDNHIDFAGGIKEAVLATQKYLKEIGKDLKIEVESRNLAEVKQILAVGGVHRIMLDNYTPQQAKQAVDFINGRVETEASGEITENTIVAYAESGVNYISVGALTHHVKSLDLSLKAV
jgi:nicotinate-nucleotide pyrophosphorylase (carboxylating)